MRSPGVAIPDFASVEFQESRDDAALAGAIAQGRGTMPGFGGELPEAAIAALVEHVRRLGAPR
jgi:hypothetical protein